MPNNIKNNSAVIAQQEHGSIAKSMTHLSNWLADINAHHTVRTDKWIM